MRIGGWPLVVFLSVASTFPACSCHCGSKAPAPLVDAGSKPKVATTPVAPAPASDADAGLTLSLLEQLAKGDPVDALDAARAFSAHDIGTPFRLHPTWRCDAFEHDVVCLTETAQDEVAECDGIEWGNGMGTFTQVRLIRRPTGSEVQAAEWPSAAPSLFLPRERTNEDDDGRACDDIGEPLPEEELAAREPDDNGPRGVASGSCLADYAKHSARRLAGSNTVHTTLELVGEVGQGIFAFRRKIVRTMNTFDEPFPPGEDPSEANVLEEVAKLETDPTEPEDFLLLANSGEAGWSTADQFQFDTLERPASNVWVGGHDQKKYVLVSTPQGVLFGSEACDWLEKQGTEKPEACVEARSVTLPRFSEPLDPSETLHPDDIHLQLEESVPMPTVNLYTFSQGHAAKHLAWFDTDSKQRTFTSVLLGWGPTLRAFLLQGTALSLEVLGPSAVVATSDAERCVFAIADAEPGGRNKAQKGRCFPEASSLLHDVDGDGRLDVLSTAEGPVLVTMPTDDGVEEFIREKACERIRNRPAGFEGCR